MILRGDGRIFAFCSLDPQGCLIRKFMKGKRHTKTVPCSGVHCQTKDGSVTSEILLRHIKVP